MSAPDAAARAAIESVIAAHPELTDFGFGVYGSHRLSEQERAEKFASNRAAMFEPRSLRQFARACDWLGRCKKIKTLNRKGTSYGLKHVAANDIGYVTNGIFIAAALASGFAIEQAGPNAYLNISSKAWRHERE